VSEHRHILVLGDQLNRSVEPLATALPAQTSVLMIESDSLARSLPHHKQKLVLVFSAMRHFARELEDLGFAVDYRKADGFEEGLRAYVEMNPGVSIEVMEPTDWGVEARLRTAIESSEGRLDVVPSGLWLTTKREFDVWAEGRTSLRQEYFYRESRKRLGWLMDGGEPVGGQWNYDNEIRKTPPADHVFPPPLEFEPDAITREVMNDVSSSYPDHFGTLDDFKWPVTRVQALAALDDFVENRLAAFGPYEDAIVEGEPVLYHSLLSVPLNLGLLHPLEVCERALEHAADAKNDVPLPSIEGFLRQVLGWREFMRHVYRTKMPELRAANGLEHTHPLPEAFWGAPTDMRCLAKAVDQLRATGHTYHIQRLMVLGNLALIARVDPRELNEWFLGCYVDALDWVVTPNVMGMSQFADLGSFTSKPYAASGNYVNRMSDHCTACVFDPKETVGQNACPLNSLYWDFIDHHRETWSQNHRMRLMVRNWERRDEGERAAILERAKQVRAALTDGSL